MPGLSCSLLEVFSPLWHLSLLTKLLPQRLHWSRDHPGKWPYFIWWPSKTLGLNLCLLCCRLCPVWEEKQVSSSGVRSLNHSRQNANANRIRPTFMKVSPAAPAAVFLVSFGWVGSLKENILWTVIAFNSKFWRLSQYLCCDKFKQFILSSNTFVFTFNVLVCCCQAGFNGMLTFLKSLSRDLSKSHIWDDLGNLCAITSPE